MDVLKFHKLKEDKLGDNHSYVTGRILTLIDSVLPEKQAKATKDIANQILWEHYQSEMSTAGYLVEVALNDGEDIYKFNKKDVTTKGKKIRLHLPK